MGWIRETRLIISFEINRSLVKKLWIVHYFFFIQYLSIFWSFIKSRVSNFTIDNDPFVRVGFPQHKIKPTHEPFPEVKKIHSEVSRVSKRKKK